MTIQFYKYQGTGNDFVMIDDRDNRFESDNLALIQKLCHRRLGIGSDGLIILRNATGFDFEMIYFNADGSQSMCGNGARCAVSFAHFLGMCDVSTQFLAVDGAHHAEIFGDEVRLEMIPVREFKDVEGDTFIHTGAPHHIRYVENLSHYPVVKEGAKIRYNKELYPEGTNVNFVMPNPDNSLQVRTYERGVEDETLSCGTGVTACALLYGKENGLNEVSIHTKGGLLRVSFEDDGNGGFHQIQLIGPATQVFSGTIAIKREETSSL
ncbi:MAG: diaminopimelate epimerase [Lunatimonas sp.]|uniref:diaminopimelate epimerase n=1 Tax=Lunatimonas sp. TaxID=2060141 RepID=UPI00263AE46C|nr:diaminopimelate epimerase [Lunatimonas sp.]MCC5937424.1 diaminopimelate epimerase [Lunatimonas sp.]